MTLRMTTDEALLLIDEVRAIRAIDTARDDARARAMLILSAARIANDDTALGDPERIINGESNYAGIASRALTVEDRSDWFSTLIEDVAEGGRLVAWKARTGGQHHVASAALDECITTHVNRAAIAVTFLLYGSSGVAA